MTEGKDEKPTNPNKQLSDSETSDEEPINPSLKTSVEESHYGTIPGLAIATQAALVIHGHKQTLLWKEDPAIQKEFKSFQKKELMISPHKLITKRDKSKRFVMTLYNHR